MIIFIAILLHDVIFLYSLTQTLSLIISVGLYLHFATSVIHEITTALGINCFRWEFDHMEYRKHDVLVRSSVFLSLFVWFWHLNVLKEILRLYCCLFYFEWDYASPWKGVWLLFSTNYGIYVTENHRSSLFCISSPKTLPWLLTVLLSLINRITRKEAWEMHVLI